MKNLKDYIANLPVEDAAFMLAALQGIFVAGMGVQTINYENGIYEFDHSDAMKALHLVLKNAYTYSQIQEIAKENLKEMTK